MNKISLIIIFGLCLTFANAFARQPAVDPTTSIEPTTEETASKVIEIPHKFKLYQLSETKLASNNSGESSGVFVYFVLIAFISLPLISWFIIERSSKSSPLETNDNVTSLADYQNEKSKESDHDDINKAS